MKKILQLSLVLVALACFSLNSNAQAYGEYLRIVYDAQQGMGGAAGEDFTEGGMHAGGPTSVYAHSGIGTMGSGSAWGSVIGNWGQDDGIGAMTNLGGAGNEWELVINIYDYYGIDETTEIGDIGIVFRSADGALEGKDADGMDIYIKGLLTPEPYAENSSGTIFEGLSVEWTAGFTSIDDLTTSPVISAFPNPFASTLNINYTTNREVASVKIYNLNGQLVSTLTEGYHQKGEHTVQLDASNLNNGYYIYVIETASDVFTDKVLLAK